MRRSIAVTIALLAIAFVFVGGPSLFASPSTEQVAPEQEVTEPRIITPEGSDSGFWPFLNAREEHERRSPINVVVRGDPDEVIRALTEQSDGTWTETDEDHEEAGSFTNTLGNESEENATLAADATDIAWAPTTGATRYAYVQHADGSGEWITETGQVHDGTYYGQRYHIRMYASPDPDDRWVAMQTHTEHFDWFTLRHQVDGAEAAQSRVERDLMDVPQVDVQEDVSRVYLENDGPSDADGWATFVELAAILPALLIGLAARKQKPKSATERVEEHITEADRRRLEAAYARLEARHLILAMTILAIVLGVRIGGIALERHATFLSMHAIAAILYPFIGLGLPIATYLIASGLERRLDAAVAASVSLAVAIWLDYGLLGIDTLPIDVVFQRMLVVLAIGLIGGGAAKRATRDSRFNDMLLAGVALWVLVLGGTLLGYL